MRWGCPINSHPTLLAHVATGHFNSKPLVSQSVPLEATNDVSHAMREFATFGLNVIASW
jgi:hypothetical protein